MSAYGQRVQLGPFFDGGELQGAAKLYHYNAGLLTTKNIWAERAMSTTLAQPFVADSQGIFNFFADGLYDIVIVGPNSSGPSSDVLYTLSNFQWIDPTDPNFEEGTAIASASTIAIGPEVYAHITGSTNIDTITGTVPFFWAIFDGNLTLNHSASLLCPESSGLSVEAGDTVLFLNEGSGVWRVSGHMQQALLTSPTDVTVSVEDGRTNSVDRPFTVKSTTTNTPATGIGTGILVQAESADETTSDFGAVDFVSSDVTAGSEDTYFEVLLRTAGAALAAAYRFVKTTAYKTIFTTAHTADRTYTLFDRSTTLGIRYDCPTSVGSGSTRTHEGSATIAVNQSLSGAHFYTDFTLNSGVTITITAGNFFLAIYATGTITINGTINTVNGGPPGGTAGNPGLPGTDQAGGTGNGGANAGGAAAVNGAILAASGITQVTGSSHPLVLFPFSAMGGGSGAGGSTGTGGRGGGSIILVAPTVVLAATATLNTSGGNGSAANAGGGGAGNVYICCHSFTDNGATFTQNGGSPNGTGNSGADGFKQINIY